MSTKTYTLRPFYNIDGYFISIPNQPTFDPKHPTIYPGLEVVAKEQLTVAEFKAKYDTYSTMYQYRNGMVTVLELTGRTSADVINDAK